jgi:hypothetical protein
LVDFCERIDFASCTELNAELALEREAIQELREIFD